MFSFSSINQFSVKNSNPTTTFHYPTPFSTGWVAMDYRQDDNPPSSANSPIISSDVAPSKHPKPSSHPVDTNSVTLRFPPPLILRIHSICTRTRPSSLPILIEVQDFPPVFSLSQFVDGILIRFCLLIFTDCRKNWRLSWYVLFTSFFCFSSTVHRFYSFGLQIKHCFCCFTEFL